MIFYFRMKLYCLLLYNAQLFCVLLFASLPTVICQTGIWFFTAVCNSITVNSLRHECILTWNSIPAADWLDLKLKNSIFTILQKYGFQKVSKKFIVLNTKLKWPKDIKLHILTNRNHSGIFKKIMNTYHNFTFELYITLSVLKSVEPLKSDNECLSISHTRQWNFSIHPTLLAIIAKPGFPINEYVFCAKHCWNVCEQNSIVNKCPCIWLDRRMSDDC